MICGTDYYLSFTGVICGAVYRAFQYSQNAVFVNCAQDSHDLPTIVALNAVVQRLGIQRKRGISEL